MTDHNKQANIITHALESQVCYMRARRQAHFAERMYRITGSDKYKQPIANFMGMRVLKFQQQSQFLGNMQWIRDYGIKKTKWLASVSSSKLSNRWDHYRKFPELKYYQELAYTLVKFSEYEMQEQLESQEFKKSIDLLTTVDWENTALNEQLLQSDPVQTINLIFWLRNLNIADLTQETTNILLEIYPTSKTQEPNTLASHNQFYSYTHLAIADSGYYQHFLEYPKYGWLVEFIQDMSENVINDGNVDLISEFGVILKLLKADEKLVDQFTSHIAQAIDKKRGLVTEVNDKESRVEHANVLAIMLLKDWDKLHKGPKIEINIEQL